MISRLLPAAIRAHKLQNIRVILSSVGPVENEAERVALDRIPRRYWATMSSIYSVESSIH